MIRTKIPKKVSGIYQIQSKSNNKIYVGSAVNLRGRKQHHFQDLKHNKHHSIYLQRHYNKYGKDDLQFSILEFCEKEKLIEREQFYIDTLKPEFNICKIAGSCLGIFHSEETKKKNSAARIGKPLSEKTKKKMSKAHNGHPVSKETKQKLSIANIGVNHPMFGKHHSEETKQKMSIAQTGEKHAMFGKQLPEETKQKISIAQSGENNFWFGKHHSEETKQKMSVARILWYKRLKKS